MAKEQIFNETGQANWFAYYVVVKETTLGDHFSCENYGVRIVNDKGGEESTISNITTSPRRIDELMELLIRGGVTPITLWDVVEDWLAAV